MAASLRNGRGLLLLHILTYILPIPVIVCYALVLTGCISNSPGLPDTFILRIQALHTNVTTPEKFGVNVGYFGICLGQAGNFSCSSIAGATVGTIAANFLTTQDAEIVDTNDLRSLISIALMLQQRFLGSVLAAAGIWLLTGILLLFFFTMVLLWKRSSVSPKTTPHYRVYLKRVMVYSLWLSAALSLASAVALTQTTGILQYMNSASEVSVGITSDNTLQVLQWCAVAFSGLLAIGVSTIFRNIHGAAQVSSSTGNSISWDHYFPPPPPPF